MANQEAHVTNLRTSVATDLATEKNDPTAMRDDTWSAVVRQTWHYTNPIAPVKNTGDADQHLPAYVGLTSNANKMMIESPNKRRDGALPIIIGPDSLSAPPTDPDLTRPPTIEDLVNKYKEVRNAERRFDGVPFDPEKEVPAERKVVGDLSQEDLKTVFDIGQAVKNHDPKALAEIVQRYAKDPEKLTKLSEAVNLEMERQGLDVQAGTYFKPGTDSKPGVGFVQVWGAGWGRVDPNDPNSFGGSNFGTDGTRSPISIQD